MPELRLYNTETRQKERVDEQDVGIYVCGVTPYDTTHLGHAFTYVAFDVLVRYLRFMGRGVTYVRNVTDIDDDILLRAHATEMDWKELGDREFLRFREDMRRLNNLAPEYEPRATEHIPEIIEITQALLRRGMAYENAGNLYFEAAKDPDFGRLCRLGYPAQLELANERGNFPGDPHKRDSLDFVLWQARKEGEPSWPSPWGEGRPGWHIECSAMSMKYLGQTIPIHGGGEDLIFPHHDAEIAQSERATGKRFVRHWMHTGMVYCGEHKMSKSLGNMVFVRDLLERYSSDAIRLLLLGHHYRQEWNFEEAELDDAANLAAHLSRLLHDAKEPPGVEIGHGGRFLEAIGDDLDTPGAIESLREIAEGPAPARGVARLLGERVLGLAFSV